jgi:hypothetical protein
MFFTSKLLVSQSKEHLFRTSKENQTTKRAFVQDEQRKPNNQKEHLLITSKKKSIPVNWYNDRNHHRENHKH